MKSDASPAIVVLSNSGLAIAEKIKKEENVEVRLTESDDSEEVVLISS